MLPNPYLEQEIARLIHTAQQFLTILQSVLSIVGPIVFAILYPKIKQRIQNMSKDSAQKEIASGPPPGTANGNPFMYEWGNQLGKRVDTLEGTVNERFSTERRLTREGFQNVRDIQDRQSERIATLESITRKHTERLTALETPKPQ